MPVRTIFVAVARKLVTQPSPQVIICDRLWENPAKVIVFRVSMFMCFIKLYHLQNILCIVHSISNILCLHFEMLVLENLEKNWFLDIFEVWITLDYY
jgi:hypothetical protein